MDPSAQCALDLAAEIVSEISNASQPQEMIQAYVKRASHLFPMDRTIAVSRRDLSQPHYRITRSDLWRYPPDPWSERDKLPLLTTGLLGDLLYAGKPTLIDPFVPPSNDPASEHFQGMGALVAIPHFDQSVALNMVVHLRRDSGSFDVDHLPELILISGLFGRAMHGLVTVNQLREVEAKLRDQNLAMSGLSDTVIEQALELKSYSTTLEDRVRARTAELEEAQLDAITMLAIATEERDDDTGAHVRRIQQLTVATSRKLGLPLHQAEALGRAAILHDVGKLHVPDAILRKPGPLTPDERGVMETHTLAGERILPPRSYFAAARTIARSHHENYDGSGYPDHAQADQIPLEARIVHVVDVYDALVNARPYKDAWSHARALEFLTEKGGTLFDPAIVQAFIASLGNGSTAHRL